MLEKADGTKYVRILNADICEGVKIGGVLQTFIRSLEVQCLPNQIPDAIQVDAAHLNVGDAVHVSELKLPEGVKAIQPGINVVASVAAQMAEEVKAEVVAAVPAEGAEGVAGEPEVITAKKKEDGAEEGKADAKAEAKPAEKKPADKK